MMQPALDAPAFDAVSNIFSNSISLSAEIIGAANTPVGIPSAANELMVVIRFEGVGARSSNLRARSWSRVVTQSVTTAMPFAAIPRRAVQDQIS